MSGVELAPVDLSIQQGKDQLLALVGQLPKSVSVESTHNIQGQRDDAIRSNGSNDTLWLLASNA